MTETEPLPTWVLIVSGFFALMEIGVSISLCVAPESALENVDLQTKGGGIRGRDMDRPTVCLGSYFWIRNFQKICTDADRSLRFLSRYVHRRSRDWRIAARNGTHR